MKVGGRDIISTGTIVTHYGDTVIDLTYEDLTFRLIFLTNAQAAETAKIDTEIFDDRLEMRLSYFDNAMGISWFGNVATLSDDKVLYLSIVVHSIGSGDTITRSIGFTFTKGVA